MIKVNCPIGCTPSVPRPYGVREQPLRCTNCTAWFRIPPGSEDGALVTGELLANPGESLKGERAAGARSDRGWPNPLAILGGMVVQIVFYVAMDQGLRLAAGTGGPVSTGPLWGLAPFLGGLLMTRFGRGGSFFEPIIGGLLGTIVCQAYRFWLDGMPWSRAWIILLLGVISTVYASFGYAAGSGRLSRRR